MSNEKTILPNSVLVSLYKDTLVLPELAKKQPEIIPNPLDAQIKTLDAQATTTEVQTETDKDNSSINILSLSSPVSFFEGIKLHSPATTIPTINKTL